MTKGVPRGFDPEISKAKHHRYGLALRWLADQMGLRDWTIKLEYEAESDESFMATCVIPDNRKFAFVSFCSWWDKLESEDQMQTMIHELMHCHLNMLEVDSSSFSLQFMSVPTHSAFMGLVRSHIENVVDDVATAWSAKLSTKTFQEIISGDRKKD